MEKSCNNCKHYYRYYIKRKIKFSPLDKGHCGYPDKRNAIKKVTDGKAAAKKFAKPELCEYWEDSAAGEEYAQTLIKKSLEGISQRLYDLVTVFRDG